MTVASIRTATLLVLLTLAAGALGGWLGVTYGERIASPPSDLHALIHRDLNLTSAQNAQIATLEEQFSVRRQGLEAEMRAANQELAAALKSEHELGPRAQAAMNKFHDAEKALQEATIKHVLAMRAVLDAKQSQKFDEAIDEALTASSS